MIAAIKKNIIGRIPLVCIQFTLVTVILSIYVLVRNGEGLTPLGTLILAALLILLQAVNIILNTLPFQSAALFYIIEYVLVTALVLGIGLPLRLFRATTANVLTIVLLVLVVYCLSNAYTSARNRRDAERINRLVQARNAEK